MPFENDPQRALSLAWYAQRKPVFTGGNQVRLLRGATELFAAQIRAIDDAQHSVWMATYLVSDQGMATQVLEALGRAAQRGVEVHLVVDGLGSRLVPASVWLGLRDRGVQV
ncbi:MAG TPA: phospholipase D-like domain-containing protein, partial [Aquabacterium sp.]|nr:phospholipase D-like domain-containing protein [Aquabacterium sp.]